MSEVKLLELPEPWQCETAMCPALYTPAQMHAYARAHLAEREREVEALRELASQLQYADKHAQVTKDVAGEFICLPPWLWIEIRDKARAALEQETTNG